MSSIHYLYAALFATAVIHGSYMAILLLRYKHLQQQMKELEKSAGR